jgi:MraZ protein
MDLLDGYEKRIAQEDPFLQTADDMSFFTYGDGAFLKLDGDGRITVSDFIRDHTGITTDVAFVGRGHFFQIWEPERLKAYGAEARSRLVRLRQAATLRRVGGDTE